MHVAPVVGTANARRARLRHLMAELVDTTIMIDDEVHAGGRLP